MDLPIKSVSEPFGERVELNCSHSLRLCGYYFGRHLGRLPLPAIMARQESKTILTSSKPQWERVLAGGLSTSRQRGHNSNAKTRMEAMQQRLQRSMMPPISSWHRTKGSMRLRSRPQEKVLSVLKVAVHQDLQLNAIAIDYTVNMLSG